MIEFFGSDNATVKRVEIEGEPTIFYGSIFFGAPDTEKVDPYFLIDTNIFSYILKDSYPATLIKFISSAGQQGVELNPAFAIAEQHRTSPNPKGYVEKYQRHLKNRFGVVLTDEDRDFFCEKVEEHAHILRENISMLEDYLAIIKGIYNSNLGEGESVTKFLSIIKEKNLPQFTFAIFVGLILFFVKSNLDSNQSLRKKVNKFLGIGKDYLSEKKRLHNAATDISIFMNCQEVAASSKGNTCTLASIVTCDEVVGHILENICIYSIASPVAEKNGFTVTIRGSTRWADQFNKYMPEIQEKLNRKNPGTEEEIKIRKNNLRNEWFLSIQNYLKY